MLDIIVRPATVDDALVINTIYNWYLEHSIVTFDVNPWSLEKREEWVGHYNDTDSPYSLMVAEKCGVVIGYACNSQFRPKFGYRSSTETSVYTSHEEAPNGTGTLLYQALFEQIKETQLHRAYGIIALPNRPSVKLHEKFGFQLTGTLSEVGTKLGRWIDVAWYEKHLNKP